MNIVVLDGFTLNPGDLSCKDLESLGKCEIHDRTPPEKVVARANAAEIVLTNKTILTREQIGRLGKVKYIGVFATGYDIVDVAAARDRGIPVTNVPAYGTHSVAQMTFALLLELTQHVGHHAQSVRDGRWARCLDFSYWDYPLVELEGLTFGIVGFGRSAFRESGNPFPRERRREPALPANAGNQTPDQRATAGLDETFGLSPQ